MTGLEISGADHFAATVTALVLAGVTRLDALSMPRPPRSTDGPAVSQTA